MNCGACGEYVPAGLTMCPMCGSTVSAPDVTPPSPLMDTPVLGTPAAPAINVASYHHCRTCRAQVQPGSVACPTCGHPPLAGTSYCFRCGGSTDQMTDPCPNCHARLLNHPTLQPPPSAAPQVYAPPYPPQYAPPVYAAPPQYVVGPPVLAMMPPPKSKAAAALLCFFVGIFGAHRFYTGQTGLGVALLLQTLILGPLTLGLWLVVVSIWVFIDFILIIAGGVTDEYGRKLT